MDFEFLKQCASEVGVELTLEQTKRLAAYFDMVVEKNKAFNLTAITEEKDFAIKHIADSLAGISEIPQNSALLDIGAGAGFPSMPIAITRADVKVTALDSTAKKMNFISECARELKLTNVKTVAGRAKEFVCNFRRGDGKGGVFAQHTSRACNAHAQNGRKVCRIQDGRERA